MTDTAPRYLELLSDTDLDVLARAAGLTCEGTALRARPELVVEALASPTTFDRLLGPEVDEAEILHVSPLLVFAVAIHRAVADLGETSFVEERFAGHRRVPVFDVESLRGLGDDDTWRLFLAELLASWSRVLGGVVWLRQGSRVRRRRFSELDPEGLASLLDAVPVSERPGIHRRLGDLALFLTGVFADHMARRALHPITLERLLRTVPADDAPAPDEAVVTDLSSGYAGLLGRLGPTWYRLAAKGTPLPPVRSQLEDVADHFDDARRFLTFVADRYLFPARGHILPEP